MGLGNLGGYNNNERFIKLFNYMKYIINPEVLNYEMKR